MGLLSLYRDDSFLQWDDCLFIGLILFIVGSVSLTLEKSSYNWMIVFILV